jgi:hypothetical protein
MFAVRASQTIRTIVSDGVEFVQLVFAKTFGAEPGDTKTETSDDQHEDCDKDERFAVGEETSSRKQLRS